MKRLVIISLGSNTARTLYEQLANLFSGSIDVQCYHSEAMPPKNLRADLILYSSEYTFKTIQYYFSYDIPYIIARRSINYHEIGKLFNLPRSSKALLVNDSAESTRDTIMLLHTLGIDHISLFPYYPGIDDYPKLKTAITPGETELVPAYIDEGSIIDIKTRLADITTIIEVLMHFHLLKYFADTISARYVQDIIKLIKTGHTLLNESRDFKERFSTVISNVHDGLIAVDKENRLSVFNPVAAELFGLNSRDVLGRDIEQALGSSILETVDNARGEGILKLPSHEILISCTPLYSRDMSEGRLFVLKDVSEIHRLEESVRRRLYQEQNIAKYHFSDIVGVSSILKNTLAIAKKMASSDSTVFIQGESGTGKELLAQSIHNASQRKSGPFVAINFAALSETLLESELFGYVEGSFTGARRGGAPGLFEAAHKGTLFLDEIGDAPLPFQVKLLRVLQERQIRRVGSSRIIPIDVRVIVATNHDLKEHIKRGLMREDLYYRLNVLPIKVPPLRKRKEDIIPLCQVFYRRYRPIGMSPAEYFKNVAVHLINYSWPGNIRELQNVVEYLTNICPERSPQAEDLPEDVRAQIFAGRGRTDDIKEIVLEEIRRCNELSLAVGRRSLAQKFRLPENKVRDILNELRDDGRLCITRGKYGLKVV